MHAVIITPLGAYTTVGEVAATFDDAVAEFRDLVASGDRSGISFEEEGGTTVVMSTDVLRQSVIRIVGEEEK